MIPAMSGMADKVHRIEGISAAEPPAQSKGTPVSCEFMAEVVYPRLVLHLTGLLIVALCLWMLAGIVYLVAGLRETLTAEWASIAEHVIIKALIMLALLEVIRTLQAYLKLGRVRVTFILDTALVVLISELMGLWFREYAPEKVLLGLGVIVTLVTLRIVTARFSPELQATDPATSR
jgi:uncharacterized membrane protein (DUF373 family)